MPRKILLAALAAVLLVGAGFLGRELQLGYHYRALVSAPLPRAPRRMVRAVSLLAIPGHFGLSYPMLFGEIRRLGATHVALVPIAKIRTVRDTTIYADDRTASESWLRELIAQARRAGLQVILMPIVRVAQKQRDEWRGTLRPSSWQRFFASYRAWIVAHARLAQESGATHLVVGSELSSSEAHEAQWRAVIAAVRRVFRGRLIYNANWDHYERVPFWSAVDIVGMSAYFGLTDRRDRPPLVELVRAWDAHRRRIVHWLAQRNKPLIFTELGYRSVLHAAARPWDEVTAGVLDLEVQRRCYEAFIRVWSEEPSLAGVVFWNWVDGLGGSTDRGYTPRGKPAAGLLSRWFGAQAPRRDRE